MQKEKALPKGYCVYILEVVIAFANISIHNLKNKKGVPYGTPPGDTFYILWLFTWLTVYNILIPVWTYDLRGVIYTIGFEYRSESP